MAPFQHQCSILGRRTFKYDTVVLEHRCLPDDIDAIAQAYKESLAKHRSSSPVVVWVPQWTTVRVVHAQKLFPVRLSHMNVRSKNTGMVQRKRIVRARMLC